MPRLRRVYETRVNPLTGEDVRFYRTIAHPRAMHVDARQATALINSGRYGLAVDTRERYGQGFLFPITRPPERPEEASEFVRGYDRGGNPVLVNECPKEPVDMYCLPWRTTIAVVRRMGVREPATMTCATELPAREYSLLRSNTLDSLR